MTASERAAALVDDLQAKICAGAEGLEPSARFRIDDWSSDGASGAIRGRGSTRVIAGDVFEKGGVNVSVVTGERLPPSLLSQRPELAGCTFFAAGVSVVLHPSNPNAPTAHCNYRFFEARPADGSSGGAWWFGGGADLTPYYPHLDDVRHFHATLKRACDAHDERYYPAFKAWCDRYFFLKHRGETRGVGGIFYDYLDERGFGESEERAEFERPRSFDDLYAFMADAGAAFVDAYVPIVETHARDPFGERERQFQLLRRGRYVEFNLVYDRGTHFGLQSGGRTESILMSLPPLVRWAYDEHPEPHSREAELARYLRPRDWFAADPFAS
jgi:coproporphyrinogen III oxidase